MDEENIKGMNVMWFRHGLRLHDNPALLKAMLDKENGIALFPVFIFDGESAGTKLMGYNRTRFLIDSLKDLDEQFNSYGGKLHIFSGSPADIFLALHQWIPIKKICMEEDCEPIWQRRDTTIRQLCHQLDIECVEEVSHTLWNPRDVIYTNGGIPPLTYQMFLHTVQTIGLPPRSASYPDFNNLTFIELTEELKQNLGYFSEFPTPEILNIFPEKETSAAKNKWKGGEREALYLLKERLKVEQNAFQNGYYLPNQSCPNILEAPKSMSAHLRFGCLSVRRFYWDVHELFKNVRMSSVACSHMIGGVHITGQLIWREYFYTMSVNNINYDRMDNNDICLTINWAKFCPTKFEQWMKGNTGYPLIDAAMRQLLAEGWIHHTLRNATATFLTRGGLWLSWEHGLQHFLKYLIDADWSVCAGNWMWVSSSAFERLLDSSLVTCPVALAKRLDPNGDYIKKYIPELKNVPFNYIHEPWRMSKEKQQEYGCLIGSDYPERIIDYNVVSKNNNLAMEQLRNTLLQSATSPTAPPHCRPSNEEEIYHFFWIEN